MTKFILTTCFVFFLNLILFSQAAVWNEIPDPRRETQQIFPSSYLTMAVDFEALKAQLLAAPAEGTDLRSSQFAIPLPTPDGGRAEFKIVESSIMAPDLQARYPEIRTFIGVGVGEYEGARVSLDFTLKGFHAQILIEGKSYYIDPLSPGDLNTYMVYSREAFFKANTKNIPSCEVENVGVPQPGTTGTGNKSYIGNDIVVPQISNGTQLRTYRLALACTGEYAQFHGGTVPLVLSAMTTTMNRVNGIFRSDVCLRMLLVANNDDLIFLDPVTDGYSNNNGSSMLGQNQTKVDAIIGSSNYDIGHVFSTGGGGIAGLGVVCNNVNKARGVTGQSNPIGDPFDVDYVAHEIGHQWDANHTQNNSCNRSTSSAFEPGSASTIMGYAGICSPNLQSNSDAYFHNHSFNEIVEYSVNGFGNSCAVTTSAANTAPSLTVPASGFSIPKSTPFELSASATDVELDAMTFCWEQYDLGPATAAGDNLLTNPSGNAPIFRSWNPTPSGTRVFPRLSDLVNNTTTIGEHLPTYGRDLTFKCTVRDSWINGAVADAQTSFAVANNSGPFIVTYPNLTTTWNIGSTQTVTWDVANTNLAPVSCSAVDIYLSTDGGYTYPTLLISNTPNDGSQSVVVPNIPTDQARIKVKAHSNIFFDISNQNFTINNIMPPTNDAICDAITLVCGNSVSGTTVNATISSLASPSCAFGSQKDVFYKIDASAGTIYTITVNGDNYDAVLALYSGACDGTLTEIDCADNGLSSGVEETITYTSLTNQSLYIRTYDWNSSDGDFIITLECEPSHDDPCDALLISCGDTISSSTYGATQGSVIFPTCASGSRNDVYFKIEAIAGMEYTVTVNGQFYDGVLVAYSGECFSSLTELDCSDVGFAPNIIETITFTVESDQTILIRTYNYGSSGQAFQISASCSNIVENDACEDAIALTVNAPGGCPANQTEGTTLYSSASNPNACEPFAPDIYYTFNSGAYSEVNINLNAITATDLVLSLFQSSCDSEGILCQIGTILDEDISVTPFTNYYVRVHSYNSDFTGSFTICIEGIETEPELATIQGSITGWNSNCAAREVELVFRNLSPPSLNSITTDLLNNGTFAINSTDIPAGTYDILVKVEGALAVLLEDVVLTGGVNNLSVGPVVLGDINNNNVINVLDLSLLSAAFGKSVGMPGYNFLADLNCDGVINIFDVSIFSSAFNEAGDIIFTPL